MRRLIKGWKTFLAIVILSPSVFAYSVLSHEAIIDTAWEDSIKPVLLRYFPDANEEQLRKAHAYSYGGAIIQDLGYYPFGSHLFTDLAHYVRSGDFIVNMLAEAHTLEEYAFALGSLAHYAADNNGHPIGVNPSVPLMYPEIRKKYGKVATYEDDRSDHLKVEFAFDVLEVAQRHYASQAYHDFIGFEVSKPVLERAVRRTYGVEMKDMFLLVDLALGTYRRSVSTIIPKMTKVAWEQKKDELVKATPGLTRRKFVYNLSRSSYEKEWGREYERPGFGARLLGFFLRIIPSFGPFKALSFRPPTPEADKLFMDSFNATIDQYRKFLRQLRDGKRLELTNTNFDTGKPARYGDYHLADKTYLDLLEKLDKDHYAGVDSALRANMLAFLNGVTLEGKPAEQLAALKATGSATR